MPKEKKASACENRKLLEAHFKAQNSTIVSIPLDGWCLVRAVARAVEQEYLQLFDLALEKLAEMLSSLPLTEEIRQAITARMHDLGQHSRRNLGGQWDSLLFDQMPQALAATTGRPLHVFEVKRGEITVTVVKPEGSKEKEEEEPIVLVRSYAELGYDHYDLVEVRVCGGSRGTYSSRLNVLTLQ